jgi:DNA-binding transcriptional regulator GbsR (MarR family)
MGETELKQFVEAWGAMGVLWGINRSMARVHALLIVSERPLTIDDVSEQLSISRGNASMSLKELRSWGVARKVNVSGERRDYFLVEQDTWSMFFRIATERKRREFDPALDALRAVQNSGDFEASGAVQQRLTEMSRLLETVDGIARRFLADEGSSKLMLQFLAGQFLTGGP